jgi:glycosyltransferase involved in cell wall biosynthesis
MTTPILIDYGCHSFTYRLATQINGMGIPIRYFVNGSLESPNLSSLYAWSQEASSVMRVITCKSPYGKLSLSERLRGELEWAGRCIVALEEEEPSAVVVSCVPIVPVTRIHNWCRKRGVPMIYWLQDFQGRAIHDLLGRKLGLPGKALGAFAQLWEQQMLEESRMVIAIAPDHVRELPEAVRQQERYALLENWANIEDFPRLPIANPWSLRHGLDKTLNILYSGTLGLKHDLGVFLALAERFLASNDVRVVVVSKGQAATKLKEDAAARGLSNLFVLPFQPQAEVAQVLASAAVLVAPLDPSAGKFCVPSKVLSYLCAGRPIVLSIDSNNLAAKTVLRAEAGVVIPSGDTAGFLGAVERLINDETTRTEMGRCGRAFAEHAFAQEWITQRFLNILDRCDLLPQRTAPTAVAAAAR